MALRRSSRAEPISIRLRQSGWPDEGLACLDHSSLPWHEGFAPEIEIEAIPLSKLADVGGRDALSIVGQYAAHLAFLQFAGIDDHLLELDHWCVVQKRATDIRLVRLRGPLGEGDGETPVLSLVAALGRRLGAPDLAVTGRSWAGAPAVYAEV